MRISDWSSDVCSSDLRAARYNGKRTTMAKPLNISPDRLFPAEDKTRDIARALYAGVKALPIVSPHGHTDPAWFATDANWSNATELLLAPDHYLHRMLYSQGIPPVAPGVHNPCGPPAPPPASAGPVVR